jgi:NADH-quinone oxidoreductase subunit N
MTLDVRQLWDAAWPALTLLIGALASLLTAVFPTRHQTKITALVASIAFLVSAQGFYYQWGLGLTQKVDFLLLDPFANFLGILISLIGLITTLSAYPYWMSQTEPIPEFFSLLLFAAFGMTTMVMSTQLLTFVLGLEVMSLSLYVLAGLRRYDPRSGEAAFKYFLLGSVATAFLLLGISFFYGATGTLDIARIPHQLADPAMGTIFKLGALLILLGFAFKVAAVPFHFWAPDAYDGAPMPVTGFMATGVKVAAFGALIRVVLALQHHAEIPLQRWIVMLSFTTMIVGNLVALRQRHLKRIMAYSSIAHAGYLLLGVATLLGDNGFRAEALSPILFYLMVYSLLTLGVFSVLSILSSRGEEVNELQQLEGLSERHPALAAALSVFLISLAGVPPTAGFLAKYYMFSQAIEIGLYPLAIGGILASAISLYYYLGPIVRMYFHAKQKVLDVPRTAPSLKLLLALMIAGVFYLGILPKAALHLTRTTQILGGEKVSVGTVSPSSLK